MFHLKLLLKDKFTCNKDYYSNGNW